MPFTVRFATEADAEAIASVLLETFIEYEPLYTPGSFAATTPGVAEILKRMSEGPMWVALADQECIGTVSAQPRGQTLFIRGMAVLPKARGQNFGNVLLEHIERWAREHDYARLHLATTAFLSRGIRLYEKFGFTDSGEREEWFDMPLVYMEKKLTSDGSIPSRATGCPPVE
jgi:GNAT superfamily N-acetyltransferase